MGPKRLFSDPIFRYQIGLIAVEPAPPDMVLVVITFKGRATDACGKPAAKLFRAALSRDSLV
jgi:hypothetical protein